MMLVCSRLFFFFKQTTAYEMRISDWSSDVCSSDLVTLIAAPPDPASLADRALAMLPASARFHDAIGIDEPGLMRHAGATHRLGTAFTGWSADGTGWLDCFGAYGPRDQAGFHQHWLIARREGDTPPFHAYADRKRVE